MMDDEKYIARTNLLLGALRRSEQPAVALGDLIAVMKEQSGSLYFAGAEGDHPFFLRNDRMAMGLAVLPEDAETASLRKRHPHQTEVIVVLDGVLRLEVAKNSGEQVQRDLAQGDAYVIEPGECHRITPVDGQDVVFIIRQNQSGPGAARRGLQPVRNHNQILSRLDQRFSLCPKNRNVRLHPTHYEVAPWHPDFFPR